MLPVGTGGGQVTTIEGLSEDGSASAAEGVDRGGRRAVRLVPVRADHVGRGAAEDEAQAVRDADIDAAMAGNICRCAHLSADPQGGAAGGGERGGGR